MVRTQESGLTQFPSAHWPDGFEICCAGGICGCCVVTGVPVDLAVVALPLDRIHGSRSGFRLPAFEYRDVESRYALS